MFFFIPEKRGFGWSSRNQFCFNWTESPLTKQNSKTESERNMCAFLETELTVFSNVK